MSRNFKAIGLALLALVAIGALSASAAQARNVTAAKYPTTLTLKNTTEKHGELVRLTIGPGAKRFVECTSITVRGTITGPTTSVTAVPPPGEPSTAFHECFSNGLTAVPATVTMKSCDFQFEFTAAVVDSETKCTTANDFIEVHIYENETKHKEGKPMCQYQFAPQVAKTTSTVTNANTGTSTEDLHVAAEFTGIKVKSIIGTAGLCGVAGGTEGEAGIKGGATITGEEDVVNPAHVAVMVA